MFKLVHSLSTLIPMIMEVGMHYIGEVEVGQGNEKQEGHQVMP